MILAMNFFVVVGNVVRHDNFETSVKTLCGMSAKRFCQRGGFYSSEDVGLGELEKFGGQGFLSLGQTGLSLEIS